MYSIQSEKEYEWIQERLSNISDNKVPNINEYNKLLELAIDWEGAQYWRTVRLKFWIALFKDCK